MAQQDSQTIPREQFLTLCINLLHKAFVEAGRTEAKKLFREIEAGKNIPLTNVRMEDDSTVRFDVSLDHSEYDGKLNYGAFSASLKTLLSNLVNAIQNNQEIPTFGAQDNPDNMIFGITGVTMEERTPAVMVLAAATGGNDAAVGLRLMYLDYRQFEQSQADDTA